MADPRTLTADVLRREHPLPVGDDKNGRGRVLVVGGSDRTPGAVLLAGQAVLRSGAGKVQLFTTAGVATACAVALPEALVVGGDTTDGTLSPRAARAVADLAAGVDAVLVGPGLDDVGSASAFVAELVGALDGWPGILVLDALALAHVREHADGLAGLRAVLTANDEELFLSLGDDEDDAASAQAGPADVVRLARRAGAVVTSGRGPSWVGRPDGGTWRCDAGNPGLGTAGSGDVLAGLVAGFAARSDDPLAGALWGRYVHGTAGDRLQARIGPLGFLAREVADEAVHTLTEAQSPTSA
ncbi:MAG: ADP/ATP-dependent (S)-NAD(P)H-hydrate dehydratase [Kineosporiaceae bacterium]